MSELILWTDLETTGLDPVHDRILEVASIVTTLEGEERGRFQSDVPITECMAEQFVEFGNEFAVEMHEKSGLLDSCIRAGRPATNANVKTGEADTFFSNHVGKRWQRWVQEKTKFASRIFLGGSSVHFDRRFLDAKGWISDLKKLHYRIVDVSSLSIASKGAGVPLVDDNRIVAHRAMADIEFSLELYRGFQSLVKNAGN